MFTLSGSVGSCGVDLHHRRFLHAVETPRGSVLALTLRIWGGGGGNPTRRNPKRGSPNFWKLPYASEVGGFEVGAQRSTDSGLRRGLALLDLV